jgi:2-polyprenyl-6-methoxyphenol hydroxylase-like FAD-dependent oxidoreductase
MQTIPSVKEWREIIKKQNDGTHPAEPAHRCSLIIFEAWMKQKCLDQPLIDFRTGWTFQSHTEDADRVTATFVDQNSQTHTIQCQYMVGCDGGRSQVRISLGVKMVGGSLPIPAFLIHFRSEELGELRPFGRYWHAVNFGMGAVINQNDKDIFTINMYILPGTDMTELDPYESIYRVLGTASSPLKIKIDEVMVHSCWKPKVAVAERWLSEGRRVLLAGDAGTYMRII